MATTIRDLNALADRMTARPLPPDTEGGEWVPMPLGCTLVDCEACGRTLVAAPCLVTDCGGGIIGVCVPCATADCDRAERTSDGWDGRHVYGEHDKQTRGQRSGRTH